VLGSRRREPCASVNGLRALAAPLLPVLLAPEALRGIALARYLSSPDSPSSPPLPFSYM
jgi:hypothetical protein